jgi:starvation-inducible outer membrane lipoprotein
MLTPSILLPPLLMLIVSCVEIATFPDNGSPSINQPEEYVSLVEHPADYQGQSLRMAGRMVGIEKQEHGSLIMAEFMLFPKNPNLRPETPKTEKGYTHGEKRRRFVVLYSEPIDPQFLWNGNEFMVFGKYTGTEDYVNLVGASRPVPHIQAQCLHIWKTGSADLQEFTDQPALGFPYYPPMERTFCLGIAQ